MAKIVCVTGCTKGLGRAMVAEFATAGWTVAGCGRSEDLLEEVRAEFGAPHWFSRADVALEGEVAAFCDGVLSEVGVPDLLLNNAAIINGVAPTWEVGAEDFSRVIDVNIKGVQSVIRHLVPAMIEKGSGVIVNFSSGWGRSTSPEVGPYCTTKWAIEGMTGSLAQELPRGMAAVTLNPGIIDTEMLRSCWGAGAGGYEKPEQWAKSAVPFLMKLGARDNGKALTAP